MKKGIHPNWHSDAQVTCSCGNTFTTGSTQSTLEVDICSKCHPFFTGEVRFVDRQGRVDKFLKKMQAAEAVKAEVAKKGSKKTEAATPEDTKSYQDILRQQQIELKKAEKADKKAA
ncbi:MAG: 50S ribosomal protein L31 [Candidatus Pacebacteria bacterium]|nr:50S ribosomal protein L31 [Candidatus Paceibacterota bacterium]PIR63381.1 MAG: 50S ribosomal protein L31 [Candidatus Pacebacteria bacterium CG10_big_fil_rev_8_21_14_0_10_40_26]PIZ79129.1 MAG: 50S ribosomal protein L31 [Candidatus Pacebacteria bacterium CG_4_10_14_0_2_um_filter_40_20]PJA69183.1 MAG: 50S ribosomal protein L31 [Candidatus Pacebacteria bacterium CG_4_9_14_3_um_filter_40_12]PJC42095.1 MAG: 50S ribosomal protein L31 [Candidatus Pacebacteria bacterium CG_4_9_14_0_2_um_filter_40_15]